MSRPVSRASIIASIVRKDIREFSRDQLYLFLSVLSLVFFVVIFWIVPNTVDETITLGVHQTGMDDLIERFSEGADEADGLAFVEFDTPEQLEGVISRELVAWRTEDGELEVLRDGEDGPTDAEEVRVDIGIDFPSDFLAATAVGDTAKVTVYTDAAVPAEIQNAMRSFVREIAFTISGNELPVVQPEEEEIVLGQDRAGDQISLRERMRPLFAFMILMMESLALASLISAEVSSRTVTAVLVTPATITDFLTAKTIYGTILALSQAVIVLIAIQAFTAANWSILLATTVIGAMLFTGIAMAVGAAGKDFIGTLFYSLAFILPLTIPAFAALFPGTAAAWVKVLPSYGLITTLQGVTAYGQGWADVWRWLGIALLWVAALYGFGWVTLKRKVESL